MISTMPNAAGIPGTSYAPIAAGVDWRTVLADEVRRWGDVLRWRVTATTEPNISLPPPTPWVYGSEVLPGGFGSPLVLLAGAAVVILLLSRR